MICVHIREFYLEQVVAVRRYPRRLYAGFSRPNMKSRLVLKTIPLLALLPAKLINAFCTVEKVNEHYINLDGHRIRYLEYGDPKAPTVVMLHGLGGSAERWARVSPIFATRFHVLVPDMIGFGLSDKPHLDYTLDLFVSFLEGFVRTFCPSRTFLIGSSLGGQIAAKYAASHPASVSKLVLVSPAGTMKTSTSAFDSYVMAALYPGEQIVSHAFEVMEASGERAPDDLVRGFIRRMRLPNAKMAFMSAVLGLRNSRLHDSLLHSISTPTLLVWGENDPVVPINNSGYFISAIRNCAFFRMDNCGHTPYVQNPDKFAGRVMEFLS